MALGGLGIRRTVDHRTAASLASQSGNLQLSQALDPAFTWDEERWNSAAEEYNSRVPVAFHVDRAQPKKILERGSFFFTQKTMLRRNPTDVPTWGVPR